MEVDKLLLKLNLGKNLSNSELTEVIDFLSTINLDELSGTNYFDEIYSYILVLGRAKKYDSRYLLEKFLELKDPTISCLIIEILCLEWKQSEEYLERVIDYALGSTWDLDDDLRHISIKALGEYLRIKIGTKDVTEKEKKILELLLNYLQDSSTNKDTQIKCYSALSRSLGEDWDNIIDDKVLYKQKLEKNEITHNVIIKAKELLNHQ